MPRKNKHMAENKEILAALDKMDRRFEEQGKLLTLVVTDMAAIKEWQKSAKSEDERWWNQTWPQHTELIKGIEDRVRAMERERVTLERMDKLEKQTTEKVERVEGQLKIEVSSCVQRLEASFAEALKRMEAAAEHRAASVEREANLKLNQAVTIFEGSAKTVAVHGKKIEGLERDRVKTNLITHAITWLAATVTSLLAAGAIHHYFFTGGH